MERQTNDGSWKPKFMVLYIICEHLSPSEKIWENHYCKKALLCLILILLYNNTCIVNLSRYITRFFIRKIFMRKWSLRKPNLNKMSRKSQASNVFAAISKKANFSKKSLKVQKLSKF